MAIIDVDLDKPSHARRTIVGYGATRSGKTHFAATAPRPLFLSDATESGWTTIQNMDRELWYEPGHKPIVWQIREVVDLAQAFARAQPLIAAGKVRTVVIDSLTFYADLYLAWAYKASEKQDTRKIYGDLSINLRQTRVQWHGLPINVIWLCLVKEPDEENKQAGPLIPGQQASKFAAGVDNIMYFRRTADAFAIHTKTTGVYVAGGREGAKVVPNPLPGSTFRDYLRAIGDPAQAVDGPVEMPEAPVRPTAAPARPTVPARAPVARTPIARRG